MKYPTAACLSWGLAGVKVNDRLWSALFVSSLSLCTDALMHPSIFKDKRQVQICSNVWTWCWFTLELIHVCLRQIDGTSSLLLISAQCCLSVTVTERLIKNHQWLIIVWLLLRIWLCKFGCHFYLECLKTGSSQAPSLRMTPTDIFIFLCMAAFKWRSCSFFSWEIEKEQGTIWMQKKLVR